MARFVSRPALVAASFLLLAQPVFPAASKKDLAACAANDPAVIIKGCTTVFGKSKGNSHTQASALYNRALAYGRQNNADLALKDLNAAYELIKDHEENEAKLAYNLHLERGKHYYFSGDYVSAEADFRAAKALNNVEPQAALNLAFALNSEEKFEEADKELFWALALDEKNASALALSGIVSFYLGNYDRAMERTNAALAQSPGMTWALSNRALITYWQGDEQMAMSDLDKVISAEPTNAWALSLRARIHIDRKELMDARVAVDAALAADPKSARAHFTNGLVLAAEAKANDAQREFDAAYNLDKTLTETLIESGKLAEAQGDPQAALGWYDKAIAAPTPSDQDKVRQERTKAARQALKDKIERPGQLLADCNGSDTKKAASACDELLVTATGKDARLPLLLAKIKVLAELKDVDEVLSLDPKNVTALMSRSMIQIYGSSSKAATDIDSGIADLDAVIAIDPKNIEAYLRKADVLNYKKDLPDAALAALDQALAVSPDDSRVIGRKANVLAQNKRIVEALPVAEIWTQKEPTSPNSWLTLGIVKALSHDLPGAEAALLQLETISPDDRGSVLLKANIAIEKGSPAAAIALTTAAMAADDGSLLAASLLSVRARAYLAAGVPLGALQDSEKVLAMVQSNKFARDVHAAALVDLGKSDQALGEIAAILAKEPNNGEIKRVQAAAQILAGQSAAAMPTIEMLLQASPADAKLIALHGRANLALGKLGAGLVDLDKASQLMPDNRPLMMERAKLRLGQKQYDEALAALVNAGDTAGVQSMRGEILLAKGDLAKALEALEAAVKLESNNVKALKLIGDIYATLGSNDMALQYYGKAIAAPAMADDAALVESAKAARSKLMEVMAKKLGGG